MADSDDGAPKNGVPLADAINALRDELWRACWGGQADRLKFKPAPVLRSGGHHDLRDDPGLRSAGLPGVEEGVRRGDSGARSRIRADGGGSQPRRAGGPGADSCANSASTAPTSRRTPRTVRGCSGRAWRIAAC
ncbi:MAG: hypothetical protein ACRDQ4_22205 [Pseudonocardiaceae bacterium]